MIKIKQDELMFRNGKVKVPKVVEMTGLNRNTLYALERGEVRRIDVETLEKLCVAFNCSVGDILEYVEEKNGDNAAV